MKRWYFLNVILLISVVSFSQQRNPDVKQRSSQSFIKKQLSDAKGDTLFYFDGYYAYLNSLDAPGYEMFFRDYDSLTPHQDNYFQNSEWNFYYWEMSPGDTLNWVEATAWFQPPGQADDWITFGPLSIPDEGAVFSWRAYHNPSFRNGYEVYVDSLGTDPLEDFSGESVYRVTDLYDEQSNGIDTSQTFQDAPKSFEIPAAYNGGSVYLAFHHNAYDMDVLHLTDFVLEYGAAQTVADDEADLEVGLYPNPVINDARLQFNLKQPGQVKWQLYDVAGKLRQTQKVYFAKGGLNHLFLQLTDIPSGIYFYSLTVDNQNVTRKLVKK